MFGEFNAATVIPKQADPSSRSSRESIIGLHHSALMHPLITDTSIVSHFSAINNVSVNVLEQRFFLGY